MNTVTACVGVMHDIGGHRRKRVCLILALRTFLAVFFTIGSASAQEIVAVPSKPSGVYAVGDEALWRLHVRGGNAYQASEIRYTLKKNGLKVLREGVLGTAVLSATLDEPGTLLAELKIRTPDRQLTALAGAAFSPERIKPVEPRPADFDGFWSEKLKELGRVPDNPILDVADSGRPAVHYYKIRLDNIRGSRIHGQLAVPKRTGTFPALLILQWAGLYPLQRDWVVGKAEAGWLTLNIMAHDLPPDRPQVFYEEAGRTTHLNYADVGNDDREKSAFLFMFLSCYRAAEYLSKRPEWNGRTLVVMGTSQGGMQAIATAALHSRVTACLANTPAGCDLNGPVADRAPGWPSWFWRTQGKDPERVRRTSRYFDLVNLAPRVQCPTLVVLGLQDVVCPASGIFSLSNQLRGPKEVIVLPQAGHGGTNEPFNRRADAWMNALAQGNSPPVRTDERLP